MYFKSTFTLLQMNLKCGTRKRRTCGSGTSEIGTYKSGTCNSGTYKVEHEEVEHAKVDYAKLELAKVKREKKEQNVFSRSFHDLRDPTSILL